MNDNVDQMSLKELSDTIVKIKGYNDDWVILMSRAWDLVCEIVASGEGDFQLWTEGMAWRCALSFDQHVLAESRDALASAVICRVWLKWHRGEYE